VIQQDPIVSQVKLIAEPWDVSDGGYQLRRRPSASINFIACHDGFTLADLVTYDNQHNEANREWEFSGECNNRSWNCGVAGKRMIKGLIPSVNGRKGIFW
jgi:isoamylase